MVTREAAAVVGRAAVKRGVCVGGGGAAQLYGRSGRM